MILKNIFSTRSGAAYWRRRGFAQASRRALASQSHALLAAMLFLLEVLRQAPEVLAKPLLVTVDAQASFGALLGWWLGWGAVCLVWARWLRPAWAAIQGDWLASLPQPSTRRADSLMWLGHHVPLWMMALATFVYLPPSLGVLDLLRLAVAAAVAGWWAWRSGPLGASVGWGLPALVLVAATAQEPLCLAAAPWLARGRLRTEPPVAPPRPVAAPLWRIVGRALWLGHRDELIGRFALALTLPLALWSLSRHGFADRAWGLLQTAAVIAVILQLRLAVLLTAVREPCRAWLAALPRAPERWLRTEMLLFSAILLAVLTPLWLVGVTVLNLPWSSGLALAAYLPLGLVAAALQRRAADVAVLAYVLLGGWAMAATFAR